MEVLSRRNKIIKIKAEINAKETKETIAKINKAKSWFFGKIKSQLSTKFKYLRHVITKSEVRFYRVSKAGFNHVD